MCCLHAFIFTSFPVGLASCLQHFPAQHSPGLPLTSKLLLPHTQARLVVRLNASCLPTPAPLLRSPKTRNLSVLLEQVLRTSLSCLHSLTIRPEHVHSRSEWAGLVFLSLVSRQYRPGSKTPEEDSGPHLSYFYTKNLCSRPVILNQAAVVPWGALRSFQGCLWVQHNASKQRFLLEIF